MNKPNKLVQLFVIATTAYSLYKIVSDFLETDTGKVVKEKASDYYDQGMNKAVGYYDEVKTAATDYVNQKTGSMSEVEDLAEEVANDA